MSYPSLNAQSRALPPIAPTPSPRKKLLIPKFHRRSSHDLPMMDCLDDQPRSPSFYPPSSHHDELGPLSPPTRPSAGPNFHSSPALGETLKGWRRSRTGSTSTSPITSTRESVLRPPRPHRDCPSAPASRPSSPLAKHKPTISSPRPPTLPLSSPIKSKSIRHSPPAAPRIPASFDAVLLSLKSVTLPRQPLRIEGSSGEKSPSTLVQLHIAGQTFIIPYEKVQRSSSFFLDFIKACLAMDAGAGSTSGGSWDGEESDGGTFSEVETDYESSRGQNRYSSDSDLLPPSFAPPPNIRASSLDKLQKLGVLPPLVPQRVSLASSLESALDPEDTFASPALTPRPDGPHQFSLKPLPPIVSSPTSSSGKTTTTFLNILFLRSPAPYTAVVYFYSSGTLLPSLRSQLEGETECGGCPLCGEADRAKTLREVEAEAKWLGLDALVRLCQAERRRTEILNPKVVKKNAGWI